MSTTYTYDQIQPLIYSADADGNTMYCEFALPDSADIFSAKATIRRNSSAGSAVTKSVTRSLVNEARRTASRLLSSVFGGGFLGRTARSTFNAASSSTTRDITNGPSKADKEAAIVEAFGQVAKFFAFNNGAWSMAGSKPAPAEATPFEAQLKNHPVASSFEKNVLARLLAHVAYADGALTDEEADFFNSSIPAEIGTVGELAAAEDVSAVEASEISVGTRETIYMLAWVISLIDMDPAASEVTMLNGYAAKFGFSSSQAEGLATKARLHVLGMYIDKDTPREELFDVADKLGVSRDDAERAKIRLVKMG